MKNKVGFDFVCERGFTELELNSAGEIRPCCSSWTEDIVFGNIFHDDVDSIINSEKAKEFRRSILNKTYTGCKADICVGAHPIEEEKLKSICDEEGRVSKFCELFNFGHDPHCNLKCIICRDHHMTNTEEQVEEFDSLIPSHFLPLLKDAQKIRILCSGELFASKHSRNLAKAIATTYPEIKFVIGSNGVLFDEANCKELDILDKLEEVTISVHAVTEKTYNQIAVGGDYKRVWKNIEWLASLKRENRIKFVGLVFTLSKYNYKEMAKFLKKCKELDLEGVFFEYRPTGSEMAKHYKDMAVWEPENKEYNKFVKILSDPIFDSVHCSLSHQLQTIRKKEQTKSNFIDKILIFFTQKKMNKKTR